MPGVGWREREGGGSLLWGVGFFPVVGVLDAEVFGMEGGVDTLLLLAFVVAEGTDGYGGEKKDSDDVNPGHHADAHVAKAPDDAGFFEAAEEDGGHEDDAKEVDEAVFVFTGIEHFAVAVAGNGVVLAAKVFFLGFEAVLTGFGEEVDETGFGIVVVGHDGGEGKEEEGDGDDDATPAVVQEGGEGSNSIFDTGKAEVGDIGLDKVVAGGGVDDVVAVGGEEHDGGGCADEEGVNIDGEALDETLFDGVVNFGGSGYNGCSALPGFIAIDATFDAPGDGSAEYAAKGLVVAKGGGNHVAEGCGDGVGVGDEYDDGDDDIGHGHEGGDDFGYP